MSKAKRSSKPIRNGAPRKGARRFATCREEVEFIGDYLADGLDGAERQAFDKHLEACPDCISFLATYKKTMEITRSFLAVEPPAARRPRLTLSCLSETARPR